MAFTPSTMAISSSVSPYSRYTSVLIWAIRGFDLALEHGLDVGVPSDADFCVGPRSYARPTATIRSWRAARWGEKAMVLIGEIQRKKVSLR